MFNVNLKKVFNSDKIVIEECELEPSNLIDHIPNLDKNYVFELNVLNEVLVTKVLPSTPIPPNDSVTHVGSPENNSL